MRVGHEWRKSQSELDDWPLSEFVTACAYLIKVDAAKNGTR